VLQVANCNTEFGISMLREPVWNIELGMPVTSPAVRNTESGTPVLRILSAVMRQRLLLLQIRIEVTRKLVSVMCKRLEMTGERSAALCALSPVSRLRAAALWTRCRVTRGQMAVMRAASWVSGDSATLTRVPSATRAPAARERRFGSEDPGEAPLPSRSAPKLCTKAVALVHSMYGQRGRGAGSPDCEGSPSTDAPRQVAGPALA